MPKASVLLFLSSVADEALEVRCKCGHDTSGVKLLWMDDRNKDYLKVVGGDRDCDDCNRMVICHEPCHLFLVMAGSGLHLSVVSYV